MNRLLNLLNTSIGRKLVVAISGIFLLLFVIGHALGNLTIYIGPSALNSYAHWLQQSPMLWLVRLGMLAIVTLHLWLGIKVSLENRSARRIAYQAGSSLWQRLFEQRMLISGLIIFIFIVAHVAHLTLGAAADATFYRVDERGFVDVYARLVTAFQTPTIAWSYITAMLLVGIHLKHSVRALFQTMGFFHDNYFSLFEGLSWLIVLFVVIGLCSIPLAIQFGWLNHAVAGLSIPSLTGPRFA
ncbi:MAG: succinate dehydrogenase cytochrome b subunit [Gammaproteobacteria bacterium]|nr:succinate dehydrogenase cytochrome b subunit [Gammaproteobacteria bacterium]MBL6999519.1 succinate dehydrogenase cytochrome b subunit [Gammaproteobacteria bacterium]